MSQSRGPARVLQLRTPYFVARERAVFRLDAILEELEMMRAFLGLDGSPRRRSRKRAVTHPFANVVPFRREPRPPKSRVRR